MKNRFSPRERRSFVNLVDGLLLNSIAKGKMGFDDILLSLPGVYPTTLLEGLKRLATTGKISKKLLKEAIDSTSCLEKKGFAAGSDSSQNRESNQLPVPHPLDFEWRFSENAIENLLQKSLEITNPQDLITLFGVPSVLWSALQKGYPRQMVLFESSQAVSHFFDRQNVPRGKFKKCNLMEDDLPKISAKLVISDPPWYQECVRSFLWAAGQLCSQGGFMLLSTPPVGTRPKIKQEWEDALGWAKALGFSFVEMQECSLPYVSPPFERNALKAEGIVSVPREWRRGNLAIFVREFDHGISRPPSCLLNGDWVEEAIEGVRFRIRRRDRTQHFIDPSLETIVPGDILPSVSRYDGRREKADVWTSGNRIFKCQGTAVLQKIIGAIVQHSSPFLTVEGYVKRKLTEKELQLIAATSDKLTLTVEIEQAEYLFYEKN
jgi:hypothetical protein